jgi:collagenase-like PrtC family protease
MPDTTQWGLAMSDSARRALRVEVEGQLQQMADSLKLSPQQRDSARVILLNQAFQLQQLRDKYTAMDRSPANRQAMMKEMQTLRDVSDARLAGVLSGEQMTNYKRMRAEQVAKMRSRMGGQTPPAEKK